MRSFRCLFRQLFFWIYLPPPPSRPQARPELECSPLDATALSAAFSNQRKISRLPSGFRLGVKPPRLIFHMSYRNDIFGGTTFQLTKTCYSGVLARLRLNVRRSVSCLCPVAIAVQESALRYRDLTYSWSGSDPPENWIWSPLSSIGP